MKEVTLRDEPQNMTFSVLTYHAFEVWRALDLNNCIWPTRRRRQNSIPLLKVMHQGNTQLYMTLQKLSEYLLSTLHSHVDITKLQTPHGMPMKINNYWLLLRKPPLSIGDSGLGLQDIHSAKKPLVPRWRRSVAQNPHRNGYNAS